MSAEAASNDPRTPFETPVETVVSPRFFGLDAVRATAMLLGVLYHAILFGGGMMGPPGGSGGGGLAPVVMNWIHSFRMPLFFLISGFFSHMMLGKYGPGRYLVRRWTRIGIPFLLTLFVLAAIRTWGPQNEGPFGGPGGPGGPERGGPGPGAGPAGAGRFEPMGGPPAGGPGAGSEAGAFPAPPPGFVPPFLERFDKDHDGSLSDEEWKEARKSLESNGPGRQNGPGRPGGFPSFGPPNVMSERLFGSASRNFNFAHLWFLWHILVYTTVALPVGWLLGRIGSLNPVVVDGVGSWLLRYGLAPLSLALVSLGGLYLSGSQPGQPPSGFQSILGVFPDAFFRWDRDWPYFFTYFIWGWWLFHQRAQLPDLCRLWLPTLAVGFVAYNCLRFLPESGPFGPFGPARGQELKGIARLGGYLLFAVAASHMGLGLVGLFQRFVNRPNPVTRYLADTAFWIYLVHQDLIQGPVLSWVRPWKLPAMAQALVVVAITVLIALAAFELVIRRTPLTTLFGPPRAKRSGAAAAN